MMTTKWVGLTERDEAWLIDNNRSRTELVTAIHIMLRGFNGRIFSLSGEVWLVTQHEYEFRDNYIVQGPRNA